ncbi:hypothetical protein GCM10023205_84980 [Yinghuangia aomiensis]|uniref:Uncharacterized protein n=1 Tax=Yinghuangia aomiensis TaxID=676205 RepID=A0ABP9IHL4_9ACTN
MGDDEVWQSWVSGLEPSQRAAAEALRGRFEALGAADAPGWARSEAAEGIPQLARYTFLRALWPAAIDGWAQPDAVEQLPAARRLLDAGTDRDKVARLARAVAYEAVFAVLAVLDDGAQVPGLGWAGRSSRPTRTGRLPAGSWQACTRTSSRWTRADTTARTYGNSRHRAQPRGRRGLRKAADTLAPWFRH